MLPLLLFNTSLFCINYAAAAAAVFNNSLPCCHCSSSIGSHCTVAAHQVPTQLLLVQTSGIRCQSVSCLSVTHARDKGIRRVEQGQLEGSALYAQQQAAIAAAAARCIQAVWRGRLARRSTASLQIVLQQQRQLDRAATAIQVCHVGDKFCPSQKGSVMPKANRPKTAAKLQLSHSWHLCTSLHLISS